MGRLWSGPASSVGYGQECGLVLVFSCSRSLYIDWRMVVVVGGGNGLHHAKREGEFSGRRKCLGRMSRGNVLHSLAIAEVRVPSLLDISAAVTLD